MPSDDFLSFVPASDPAAADQPLPDFSFTGSLMDRAARRGTLLGDIDQRAQRIAAAEADGDQPLQLGRYRLSQMEGEQAVAAARSRAAVAETDAHYRRLADGEDLLHRATLEAPQLAARLDAETDPAAIESHAADFLSRYARVAGAPEFLERFDRIAAPISQLVATKPSALRQRYAAAAQGLIPLLDSSDPATVARIEASPLFDAARRDPGFARALADVRRSAGSERARIDPSGATAVRSFARIAKEGTPGDQRISSQATKVDPLANFPLNAETRWDYSRNERIVTVPEGMKIDEALRLIRADFGEFKSFSKDNIAEVKFDPETSRAFFKLENRRNMMSIVGPGNDFAAGVGVVKSGDTQAAITLSRHQLRGIRIWDAKDLGDGRIALTTEAFEIPRLGPGPSSLFNAVGTKLMRGDQATVWDVYFKNIDDKYFTGRGEILPFHHKRVPDPIVNPFARYFESPEK